MQNCTQDIFPNAKLNAGYICTCKTSTRIYFHSKKDIFANALHQIYLHIPNQIQDIFARVKLHLDILRYGFICRCHALDNDVFAHLYITHARLYRGHFCTCELKYSSIQNFFLKYLLKILFRSRTDGSLIGPIMEVQTTQDVSVL